MTIFSVEVHAMRVRSPDHSGRFQSLYMACTVLGLTGWVQRWHPTLARRPGWWDGGLRKGARRLSLRRAA